MAQRMVASQASPRTDKQLKAVIETITDLVHGHRRNTRCRQFDGQGDSVETAADLGNGARIVERETRSPAVAQVPVVTDPSGPGDG
jgi:hypothetical protein